MRRVVDVLYGVRGYPNAVRFGEFKTDLFAYGSTPTMTVDTAGTNGITVSAAMTSAAILLSSTYLYGLYFNGVAANTSTGIKFKAGYLGHTITTGDYASATDKGVTLTSTNDYNAAFLADDSDASIGASVRNLLARTYLGLTQAGGTIRSLMGQLKLETGTNLGTGVYCATQAYLEFAGTHSISTGGKVSGLDVSLEVGSAKTVTVDSGGYLAGVKIELTAPSGTATVTQTGDCAAVYVDKAGTITDWKVGVDLQNCTTGIDIGACTTGINFSGTASSACIDFSATSVTTGSLLDYIGITGKVSGYLFNGSMTTSTLTSNTLIDDFSCSCAHDGAAGDTLRMIRRIWSGALPNGTAAADFVMAEFQCTSTIGTAASKSGAAYGVKIDFGSATINDSSLTLYGLYVDTTVTNTLSAAVHGIYVTSAQYGVSIGDDCTTAINIVDASDVTNLFRFNELAGCVIEHDVDPNDAPSDGGLGADACIQIDIGGQDFYIPCFASYISS